MPELVISIAHRAARNQASLTLADAGAGASTIKLYSAKNGTLLGTRSLQSPCGAVNVSGRIELHADTDIVDLMQTAGAIAWAEWCDGDGTVLLGGTVTDESGDGPIKMPGTNGTTVDAGGIITLVEPVLIG